jgi:5-methyltetrahydropteroyltriglutamate--homocysteine methyltransferase
MNLVFTNNGSYPRIGDTPELQLLRRTIAQWEKGERKEEELRDAVRQVTKTAIAEQLEAGVTLPTDGQIRWYDPISHIAGTLEGVKINGLLRYFDTNFYFRQPVVQSRLKRIQPILVEDYKYAASVSSQPVKVVVTGPFTLAKFSISENGAYKSFGMLVEDYTSVIAAEIESLVDAGARTIQVDEPAILKHPEDFSYLQASVKELSKRKAGATLALYTYFGDAAPLLQKLLDLPVDAVGIDFTYNSGLAEMLRVEKPEKALGLGLIDGRNTRLEAEATVAGVLEKLLPAIRADFSYLNPSCGLEYLPRDKAFLKLKNMVSIGRKFLSSN